LDLKAERERERESQFNIAGGIEFQVRGVAVLNDRLANDVRRNGTSVEMARTAVGRTTIECACAGAQRDVLAQILQR